MSATRLFDDPTLGVFLARPTTGLADCNLTFARLLGFESVGEALGSDLSFAFVSAERQQRFYSHLEQHGRIEYFRGPIGRRDGRVSDVVATIVGGFDASGTLAEIRGFMVDVGSTSDGPAALKARERHFQAIFVEAADPMLLLDDRRQILDVNHAACGLFGTPAAALTGRKLEELLVGDLESLDAAWRELLAIGEAKREHHVRCEGRSARLVECSYRGALYAGQHLCIARDVTDRHLLEQRLVQSEKIDSVGRLAGGIAHDFNNLLTAILGYTEMLLAERAADHPDRADLEQIQKAGQRAATLTQKLLAYGGKQMLTPQEVDLNETIGHLESVLRRLIREDIAIKVQQAPAPARVKIDPTQLEQVVLNLVSNAQDALPSGGTIGLDIAKVYLSESDLPSERGARAGDYVRLRVTDDGVGIAPEVRAHLFEPFFTTKGIRTGSGLGLASVYGIVRQSSGFISVDSEVGGGTTFTMHFPALAVPERRSAIGAPRSQKNASGQATILLAEDEDAVRAIVCTVLRRQGYRVLEASGGKAACEIFERQGSEIDLLLTDVVMPEMSGPALAQRLVAVQPQLRVLFMSGYSEVSPLDPAHPNTSFLSKPFQASVLAEKVKQVLSRAREAS